MLKPLKKTRGLKLPLVAGIGIVFALVSVLGRASTPTKEPFIMPPVAQFPHNVAGIGIVEPQSELIAIGTELPGVVRQVHVKVGDNVKAGDPLFSLDQRDIDSEIKTLKANLDSTRIQADDADAQFDIVKDMQDKRAVAKDDYNRRKFASQLAQARVAEIEAKLEQAQTTKERLTVRAPIDGSILQVDIRAGEFASAGALANPLIRMGDVSVLNVRVEIDEENAVKVTPEAQAKALRRGKTQTAIPLKFVRFEPYVRPKQNLAVSGQRVDTRVLQIIYALPEGYKESFVGQQMDVFIAQATPEKSTVEAQ